MAGYRAAWVGLVMCALCGPSLGGRIVLDLTVARTKSWSRGISAGVVALVVVRGVGCGLMWARTKEAMKK